MYNVISIMNKDKAIKNKLVKPLKELSDIVKLRNIKAARLQKIVDENVEAPFIVNNMAYNYIVLY